MSDELSDALEVLEKAGERWLETKASGKDTSTIDAEVAAAEQVVRRLQGGRDYGN